MEHSHCWVGDVDGIRELALRNSGGGRKAGLGEKRAALAIVCDMVTTLLFQDLISTRHYHCLRVEVLLSHPSLLFTISQL